MNNGRMDLGLTESSRRLGVAGSRGLVTWSGVGEQGFEGAIDPSMRMLAGVGEKRADDVGAAGWGALKYRRCGWWLQGTFRAGVLKQWRREAT